MKYGDKVQFLYVNTKDKVGMEGGEIALAEKLDNGSYTLNAYAIFSCTSGSFTELKAIVFDVNNDLDGQTTAGLSVAALSGSITGANASIGNVTAAIEGDSIVVTVTTTAAATSDCTITVTPSGTGINTTPVTGTVANGAVAGTVITITVPVSRASAATPISGIITLTVSGTVA